MTRIFAILLVLLFCLSESGCRRDEIHEDPNREVIKAWILGTACSGTAMQIIGSSLKGEPWKYYPHKDGIFDRSSRERTIYENCVLVSNVPAERRIIGDTLLFTYYHGYAPGNFCDLGFGPNLTISIQSLKN